MVDKKNFLLSSSYAKKRKNNPKQSSYKCIIKPSALWNYPAVSKAVPVGLCPPKDGSQCGGGPVDFIIPTCPKTPTLPNSVPRSHYPFRWNLRSSFYCWSVIFLCPSLPPRNSFSTPRRKDESLLPAGCYFLWLSFSTQKRDWFVFCLAVNSEERAWSKLSISIASSNGCHIVLAFGLPKKKRKASPTMHSLAAKGSGEGSLE